MQSRAATTVAIAVAALSGVAVAQDEQSMTMQDVPHAAMAAARAAGNGIEFERVGLDLDGGQATYELAGKGADGMMLEVDVLADGRILEIERQVEMGSVPEKVTTLLGSYLDGFEPTLVEESTHENFEVWYEFEGTMNGKTIDAEVSSGGDRILIQDDQAG